MRTGKLAGVILAALIAAAMMRIPVYAAPAAAGGYRQKNRMKRAFLWTTAR